MPETVRDPFKAIAAQFVQARQSGLPLDRYPGEPPPDLTTAYAIQDAAIALWPDRIAGWKVGLVQEAHRARYGAARIAGPIFSKQVARMSEGAIADLSAVRGGFGAVEAELVLVVEKAPPLDRTTWTVEDAAAYSGRMHVGLEFAGSPFRGINDLGPAVTASDFGNNSGLVLGREIANWRSLPLKDIVAEVKLDGDVVGRGSASDLPGGPLTAFAFILAHCAERGLQLQPGDLVSTGAITGVHTVQPGQVVNADFGPWGAIACRVVDAASSGAQAASA